MVPKRFQGASHLLYRKARFKGQTITVYLAKTPRTLLLFVLLILFTQASVAGAMVHTAPAPVCESGTAMAPGAHPHSSSGVDGQVACQAPGSQASDHALQGSGDLHEDCCLDCECSLSQCSTSAASSQEGLASWFWASRKRPPTSLLPLNPAVSNLLRPPILG